MRSVRVLGNLNTGDVEHEEELGDGEEGGARMVEKADILLSLQ